MFNNVGRKISTISKFVFYLTSILLLIISILLVITDKAIWIGDTGIVIYIERSSRTGGVFLNGLIVSDKNGVYYSTFLYLFAAIGIIIGLYICTLFLVGFGELIENTSNLRPREEEVLEEEQVEEELEQNDYYDDIDKEERTKR